MTEKPASPPPKPPPSKPEPAQVPRPSRPPTKLVLDWVVLPKGKKKKGK